MTGIQKRLGKVRERDEDIHKEGVAKRALKLMEQGFNFGGRLYRTRGDLHER